MSITVGIQSAVSVVSATVNDKQSLEIMLEQGEALDLMEAMNSGASSEVNSQKLLFFPVDNKWFGKEATHQEMVMKFRQLTAKLAHLISVQGEAKFNMFEGTGIATAADIAAKITKEATIAKISLNIYAQFAAMVEASDKTKKSRIKFVRQSAAKHYATLPEVLNFKKDGGTWETPFVESMEIPEAQSKLAYTKKEIEKGLNSAAKVGADTTPSGSEDLPFSL
jgi:hypothetical protein